MALEEKAVVVDENDTVIAYKNRNDVKTTDIVRIVVIWLENTKGEVLVHKRSATKKHGANRWENAAGGGVEQNETYEQAAYKELREEIGVDDVILEFVTKNVVHTNTGNRVCSWYRGVCDRSIDEFVLEEENVVEVKWIDKLELFQQRDSNPDAYMPSSVYWRELFSE